MATPGAKRRVQNRVIVPAGDPYWANVVLLLGCKGPNGSTTFVDSSLVANTMTAAGTAQISTAQFMFPSSSGAFLTGANVSAPDSTDWYLEPGDFTIELWYRPSAIGTRQFLCGQGNVGATSVRNLLEVTAAGKFRYFGNGSAAVSVVGTTTLVAGNWYFLSATKSGTDWRVFVNGNLDTTLSSAATFTDFAGPFYVGRCGAFTSLTTNGYLEQFRITKGVARYTASFTPPAAPFPTS